MNDDGNPAKGCLIVAVIGLVVWLLIIWVVLRVTGVTR